jgi:hypothetical protein
MVLENKALADKFQERERERERDVEMVLEITLIPP